MRTFQFLKNIRFYNSLIFTKNKKNKKKQFQSTENTKLVLYPGRILPCKQNIPQLYTTNAHVSAGGIKAYSIPSVRLTCIACFSPISQSIFNRLP